MEQKNNLNQFDDFFRSNMEAMEPDLPTDMWQGIDQAANAGKAVTQGAAAKSVASLLMKAALVVLPIGAITWLVLNNQTANPVADKTTSSIQVSDNQNSKVVPDGNEQPNKELSSDQSNINSIVTEPNLTSPVETKGQYGDKSNIAAVPQVSPGQSGRLEHSAKQPVNKDFQSGGLIQPESQGGMQQTKSPSVAFKAVDTEICFGEAVELENLSDGVFNRYEWDFDDDHSFNTVAHDKVTHVFERPGVYNISLTAFRGQQKVHSMAVRVKVLAVQAYFTIDRSKAPELQFINQSVLGNNYVWNFGDHSDLNRAANPYHRFQVSDKVTVRLVAQNGACADTFQMEINPNLIKETDGISVPNVITPNGDGYNERWIVEADNITSYKVAIYDRIGNKVWESNDAKQGWKGICADGRVCPPGDYYYYLTIGINGKSEEQKLGLIKLMQ